MPPNNPSFLFSVIICTYNRASLLEGALKSVIQQTMDSSLYEIVVVDNCSTDTTPRLVDGIQSNYPMHNITYVYEPKSGLGFARLTGIHLSTGSWISFLDDDAMASPDWLERAYKIILAEAGLDGLGGRIYPYYLATPPDWFLDRYEMYTWGDTARLLHKGEAFAGSNMFFRRGILEKISPAMHGLGMNGNIMDYGEDTVLFERAWQVVGHPKFYYDPELTVRHATPSKRMEIGYILRRQFSIGASNFKRNGPRQLVPRIGFILRHTGSLIRLTLRMLILRVSYSRQENWFVECGGPVVKKLGLLLAAMGLQINFQQRTKIPVHQDEKKKL